MDLMHFYRYVKSLFLRIGPIDVPSLISFIFTIAREAISKRIWSSLKNTHKDHQKWHLCRSFGIPMVSTQGHIAWTFSVTRFSLLFDCVVMLLENMPLLSFSAQNIREDWKENV